MKISIITVVYNCKQFLADCIESVIAQTYSNIEYIIIDGGSTDGSLGIIEKYKTHIDEFISEKDQGMYDALNKGIKMASGDIVGILNADDMLATNNVIENVVNCFRENITDGVYGDLNYIDPYNTSVIVRKWVSKPFTRRDIELGWMPAHPTLYLKRSLFKNYGDYSLDFGTAADYELMLRYLYFFKINATYLNKLMVNMRTGGMSNATAKHRYHALINDYKALQSNRVAFPLMALLLKKFSKLAQYRY
ncbi:MAG: glycosyltransferase family 2 protein [Bacteroidota bacterium]